MRTILMLVVLGVVLVGAGVLHVSYNKETGSATINVDKAKARERLDQVIEEAKSFEGDAAAATTTKK
ncbi:MAG TPA: hypothetical protein VGJ26_05095 [Pirellulales bacterium]|jgi:hypothetical protein